MKTLIALAALFATQTTFAATASIAELSADFQKLKDMPCAEAMPSMTELNLAIGMTRLEPLLAFKVESEKATPDANLLAQLSAVIEQSKALQTQLSKTFSDFCSVPGKTLAARNEAGQKVEIACADANQVLAEQQMKLGLQIQLIALTANQVKASERRQLATAIEQLKDNADDLTRVWATSCLNAKGIVKVPASKEN